MRKIYTLFLCFQFLFTWGQETIVRITENPLTREYKLLFSSPVDQKVVVALYSFAGKESMQETFDSKGFVKKYFLKESPLGRYYWEVKYGDETFRYDFELMNEKKLLKESINMTMDDFYNLSIEVKPYNEMPLSVFLYNISGKQLDHFFWELDRENRKKVVPLTKYEAYDVKVEVLQQGDVVASQVFKMY